MNWFLWLRRPATAWALAGLTVVLAAALVPLSLAAGQNPLATGGANVVIAVSFAAVGLVVAWHRPQNPIGWLMLVLATGFIFSSTAACTTCSTTDSATGQLLLSNGAYSAFGAPVALIFFAFWALAIGYQVVSWRRASGERRQQLSWLMAGGAAALISFLAAIAAGALPHGVRGAIGDVLVIGIAALPAGMGVAILRYRLYEIDRIISRTLAYAIVTGLLVGVYAGLVLLATRVLAVSSPVAVAASTLAAAALFTPVRRRVQRVVDRRFNRVRYDGDRMVEAFAVRLKDAVDLETVRADLAGVVSRALEPGHVSLWINERG